MEKRRAFRETVRNAGRRAKEIVKKLNPEPAVSKFMLNRKVRKLLVKDGDKIDWNAIRELVEAGASPDIKCRWGHPMLVDAAWAGRIDVCRFLLERGAKVGARGEGKTALAAALSAYKEDVRFDFGCVNLLLENGANIETAGDYLGSTALAIAIRNQNLEEIKYLVEKGADVNTRTIPIEKTALMIAAREGDLELCRLLIKKGAEVDAADYSGNTALRYAIDRENLKIAKLLVMYGADIYKPNNNLESADSTAYRKMPDIKGFFIKIRIVHSLLSKEKDKNKGSISGFAESLGYANGGSYKIFMSNFAECVGA
jgi:ankyrin repeat protein